MALSLKDLCYYLNFDETAWNKNKDMLGYNQGEKYEDFFYRKHGFKHTEQSKISKEANVDLETQVRQLTSENKIQTQNIQELTIQLRNMETQLTKMMKGYTPVSKIIIQT